MGRPGFEPGTSAYLTPCLIIGLKPSLLITDVMSAAL